MAQDRVQVLLQQGYEHEAFWIPLLVASGATSQELTQISQALEKNLENALESLSRSVPRIWSHTTQCVIMGHTIPGLKIKVLKEHITTIVNGLITQETLEQGETFDPKNDRYKILEKLYLSIANNADLKTAFKQALKNEAQALKAHKDYALLVLRFEKYPDLSDVFNPEKKRAVAHYFRHEAFGSDAQGTVEDLITKCLESDDEAYNTLTNFLKKKLHPGFLLGVGLLLARHIPKKIHTLGMLPLALVDLPMDTRDSILKTIDVKAWLDRAEEIRSSGDEHSHKIQRFYATQCLVSGWRDSIISHAIKAFFRTSRHHVLQPRSDLRGRFIATSLEDSGFVHQALKPGTRLFGNAITTLGSDWLEGAMERYGIHILPFHLANIIGKALDHYVNEAGQFGLPPREAKRAFLTVYLEPALQGLTRHLVTSLTHEQNTHSVQKFFDTCREIAADTGAPRSTRLMAKALLETQARVISRHSPGPPV